MSGRLRMRRALLTPPFAPVVVAFVPADDATGVAVDADLVATFNRPVFLGSAGSVVLKRTSDAATVDSWRVVDDAGSGVGEVEITNDVELRMHLTGNLDNSEEYYVVFPAGVVVDSYGTPCAALTDTTAWSFTTTA